MIGRKQKLIADRANNIFYVSYCAYCGLKSETRWQEAETNSQ